MRVRLPRVSRRRASWLSRRAPLFLAACLAIAARQAEAASLTLSPPSTNPLIAEGDAHYQRRQDGHVGERADSREILEAIAAYETAAQAPGNAQARWKLARALYFRGAYTGLGADSRRVVFERARRVSEEAIGIVFSRGRSAAGLPPSRIADAVRGDPDAAPVFFWAAVSWGEWALSIGKLEAVRRGAAAKIRDDAAIVVALDPRFEEGGGYRILGRLHDQAPRVPFLTWWVSRKEAITNLRNALAVAPDNVINLHFLAEALARSGSSRAEAVRLEEQVLAAAASPARLVEETHIQDEAKRNLARWNGLVQ